MQKKLPVIDPVNLTMEGDLILSEPELKLGESELIIEKVVQKYNILENGDIGEKIDIDMEGWEVSNESDFEILLSQKRIAKMNFIREPQKLQKFINLSSIIFGTVFEVNEEGVKKVKMGGFAYIVQDEIFGWIQMASSLILEQGERVNLDSAIQFFTYYMKNNSQIERQSLIFLARPDRRVM